MPEVSTFRLYLLRTLYLLIFVGQGSIQLSRFLHHAPGSTFWNGVGSSMLASLALVAALGIRYPLQMLPLLFFEWVWKMIWLLAVALPLWSAHHMDAGTAESVRDCLIGAIIVPIVMPWPYVLANYLKKPGDRWR